MVSGIIKVSASVISLVLDYSGYHKKLIQLLFKISTTTYPRRPGFWKLNTNFFLTESEYVELIKKTIQDVSKEYKGHREVDKILLWDVVKMEIRAASIKYAKVKNHTHDKRNTFWKKTFLQSEKNLTSNTSLKQIKNRFM